MNETVTQAELFPHAWPITQACLSLQTHAHRDALGAQQQRAQARRQPPSPAQPEGGQPCTYTAWEARSTEAPREEVSKTAAEADRPF